MKVEKVAKKLDDIKELVLENKEIFDGEKLLKEIEKLERSIKNKAVWPKEISDLLSKLKRRNLNKIAEIAREAGLEKIEKIKRNKTDLVFQIGIQMTKNYDFQKKIRERLTQRRKTGKRKSETAEPTKVKKDIIKKWLDMDEKELRKELGKYKVKELREITKNILPSEIRKKRKRDLIEAIIFKLSEVKHQYKMGPA
ncbi:MAG: hypothetical protein ACP6IP_04335 [Candidatus Njordarchaeia archaeon]